MGGKNPELTVCQVRTAAAAVVEGLRLGTAVKELAERAARTIERAQRENSEARESHRRDALAELKAMRIDLSKIIQCRWTER